MEIDEIYNLSFEEMEARFVFNFSHNSVIPDCMRFVDLSTNEKLLRCGYETLANTGFYDQTKFKKLALAFIVVPNDDEDVGCGFSSVSRLKMLMLTIAIRREEVVNNIRDKDTYFQYVMKKVLDCMLTVCEKYKLDKKPVEQELDDLGFEILQATPCIQITNRIVEVEDEEKVFDDEEMVLHIKLDSEFGDPNHVSENHEFVDSITENLAQADLGTLELTETGQGYQSFYFMGDSAAEMAKVVESVLLELPAGSILELAFRDGTRTQIRKQGSLQSD